MPRGFGLGALPALAYLAATDAWWDYWQRGFVIAAASELPRAGTAPLHWIEVMIGDFRGGRAGFALGAAGFLAFALSALRGGARGIPTAWLDPRLGPARGRGKKMRGPCQTWSRPG